MTKLTTPLLAALLRAPGLLRAGVASLGLAALLASGLPCIAEPVPETAEASEQASELVTRSRPKAPRHQARDAARLDPRPDGSIRSERASGLLAATTSTHPVASGSAVPLRC